MPQTNYHQPVLLDACLNAMELKEGGVYVDLTFGGGGHSREILARMGAHSSLIAFDQDPDAQQNLPSDPRLLFIPQNFSYFGQHIRYQGFEQVDAVLADLGVSSYQLDKPERGFSYRFDEQALDMRMDQAQSRSAADVVNSYSEEELANVLYMYGELDNSRRLAASIFAYAKARRIATVGDLKKALTPHLPKIHDWKFLSKVFQALRIEVNQEMDVLKRMLLAGSEILRPGGRFVIMSYHSLEDRLVKNFFHTGNFEGEETRDLFGNSQKPFRPISRKAIVPDAEELERNPRSRSAKLRIAEKLG